MVRLNRRNVLISAGTIVAGGGAALGTGAFSQVEASRTVSVETTGDADALVAFAITTDELDGSDDDTIEFDTDTALNLDAVTTFEDAFTITNNRDSEDGGPITVQIQGDDDDGPSNLITDDATAGDPNMYFESGNASDGAVEIGTGDDETFDVVFNLTGLNTTADGDDALPDAITIIADDSS